MTASRVEEPMPPTPILLKCCITEDSRLNMIVERVVNTHFHSCPRRQDVVGECNDGLCRYFTWHLNHHTTHRQNDYTAQDCQPCVQFESWIKRHSTHYCQSLCGLSLCNEIKKRSVKNRCCPPASQRSLTSSLKRTESIPSSPSAFYDESKYNDDTHDGYCSGATSSNSSPSCTEYITQSLPDPEATLPVSAERLVNVLPNKQHPESSLTPAVFRRTESHERGSISHESHLYYRSVKRGSSGSDISHPETEHDSLNGSFNSSLIHVVPQPDSDLHGQSFYNTHYHTHHNSGTSYQSSTHSQRESMAYAKKQESDSAISSSENEDTESETPAMTLESVSTPSTVQGPSFGTSGSSAQVVSPVDLPNTTGLPRYTEEPCQLTDQLLEQYSTEIKMLNNRGRPLYVNDPPSPETVPSHALAHIDLDWRESYAMPSRGRPSSTQALLTEQYTVSRSFTEDDTIIERSLDHRDSVREYLKGQFYLQQTYCEHVHWRRVRQIGHGGQARCFCIEDNVNKYPLCLKEETESKKALDEAFICLKLAMLVRDAPQYIVEFFGASILPHYTGNNHLQLFLELMPGCLQGYVFENGPLCPETTLNYSYQLFEALDYLHQRLKVIHCDIKPANLLIDYNCQRLKVADFGCAELLEECCHGKGFPESKDAGTLWYNPPEYYWTGNCTFGMDIWQAGCSVLFMITGRRPWRHLCMDVDKQNSRVTPGQAKSMKKIYCDLIGRQGGAYPLPGFLTSGVRQLLLACLQSTGRLSAKDCVYLAAVSETTSAEQKSRIVEKLGYTPTHAVLENLQNAPQITVDVYLGKERFNTDLDGIPRAMLNGWLGSVPYQNSMTYGDLLDTVRQLLPVTQYFGDCGLAISDNNPQAIWKAVGIAKPYRVRPDQVVDPARAFILLPKERSYS